MVEEKIEESVKDKLEQKQKEFDALFKRRTEETYPFEILNLDNLNLLKKYIKDKKVEWTGTESVGYVNAILKIEEYLDKKEEAIKEDGTIDVPAYLMEAISFFLNKYKGNGYYEAKNFVKISYPVQKTILLMRKDDETLKQLRENIGQLAMLGDNQTTETA